MSSINALPETYIEGFHDEQFVKRMEYVPLGQTGLKVSKISLGTATLSQLYNDVDEAECIAAVQLALRRGINYIDTAPYYGQGRSEEVLGKALKTIPRDAYYMATKVARYEPDYERMFDFSAKKTRESVEKSLRLLGVDYIDVVQIHDIEFGPNLDVVLQETLTTLEALRNEGKIKFIGVTSYLLDILKQSITKAPGRFDTILSYSRNTLFDDSLKDFLPFFLENRLAVICAAGHALGLLTNAGPQPWHPAHEQTKAVCREAAEYCRQNGVELGKLAMHHFIQLPGPSTFLSGMQTQKLVAMNLDAYFSGLTAKEAQVLTYLKERVFPKMKKTHWEGVELEKCHEALKAVKSPRKQ